MWPVTGGSSSGALEAEGAAGGWQPWKARLAASAVAETGGV